MCNKFVILLLYTKYLQIFTTKLGGITTLFLLRGGGVNNFDINSPPSIYLSIYLSTEYFPYLMIIIICTKLYGTKYFNLIDIILISPSLSHLLLIVSCFMKRKMKNTIFRQKFVESKYKSNCEKLR